MSNSAGRLTKFFEAWKRITSDSLICSWVKGYKIPFQNKPVQAFLPQSRQFSNNEYSALQSLIPQLLKKGAIVPCEPLSDQFLSPIFLEPKPDGSYRLILNLKILNTFISTEHFKLEDFRTASRLITPNCYMAKLDLKDAYYLVAIDPAFRKFLRFQFDGVLYEFTCLPFGLSTAPYVFTKLLRPVVSTLRQRGLKSVVYLDDFLLIGNTFKNCINNVFETVALLAELGFLFSPKKCHFPPTTSCQFLGFSFDSTEMILTLPDKKRESVSKLIKSMENKRRCSIRRFAQFLGTLAACCPAIKYSWCYTKKFERDKFLALQNSNGDYNASMFLTCRTAEFSWWKRHIWSGSMSLLTPPFEMEIFSDASKTGWGVSCQGQTARGSWTPAESQMHINHLELLAALFGLKSFAKSVSNIHILLRIDNTTAIAYINRMGGVQNPRLNDVAFQIWQFCESANLFVFASYIRSAENTDADAESRKLDIETEYELAQDAFYNITSQLGYPEVDLFASRTNFKCRRYFSWKCDPESEVIDAFTVPWTNLNFYAFPPFSIILKALQKIIRDESEGIMVVPAWPGQPWFPVFKELLVSPPIFLNPSQTLLCSLDRTPHPLWKSLSLVAGRLSGKR